MIFFADNDSMGVESTGLTLESTGLTLSKIMEACALLDANDPPTIQFSDYHDPYNFNPEHD